MIETHPYNDFGASLFESGSLTQVPVNGTIELSHRCPLECAHCYNNLPMDDGVARRNEMTTEEIKRVLDELAEVGCLWLCFTGGEIFARADFMDIYRHAKERGFLITLFTNGTLITERIADQIAAMPPFAIEITLYGRTKAVYESLTGIPGSFEKCMRGIDLLIERKLPLALKTVAVTINKHELKAMKKFADEKGVEFKFDQAINPRIDCSASPLAVRLSPAEVVAIDLEDTRRAAEWRYLAVDLAAPPLQEGEIPLVYDCGGGISSFAIDPYGNMSICVLSKVDQYNVREGSVREGWEKFLHSVRFRHATRITKCSSCALHSMCGSCAAFSELENGDPEEPVDFLCRTAHLRAEIFDIAVRPHGDCEYCIGGSGRHEIEAMAEDVRTRRADLIAQVMQTPLGELPAPASSCATSTCSSCSLH
jgi:radical SAM protein with 4Fe4S-binding SPASM domain